MKNKRQQVYDKYEVHCAYCGDHIDIKAMQVDHYLPKANFLTHVLNKWKVPEFLSHLTRDDVNHIDNLMPSCRSCNKFKDTFHMENFRNEVEQQVVRLRKYKPTFRLAERYGLISCEIKPVVFYFEKLKQSE